MYLQHALKSIGLFATLILMSCDDNDDSGQPIDPTPSTFEIISNSEDHTILEQALLDTGLDEVLNSGVYTIFAPDDDAFSAVDLNNLSNEALTNILLYHVINGNASSTDFGNGYLKTNATESFSGDDNFLDIYVNVDGGITLNEVVSATSLNNQANNGNVHVVDAVLTLPTVENLVGSNTNFSNLADALAQENLLGILSTDADTSPAPFTVFAPDNTAFDAFIAEDNGFDSIEQILNDPNLTDILTYHVLAENVIRESDITDGITPTTIQGETFTINITETVVITDQNNRMTNIVGTNVTASNGVIHFLDNVLLPMLP